MRWLIRLQRGDDRREPFLASMKALARLLGVDVRNPKWTSYGALELDVFSPTAADFETFLAAVKPIADTEFVTDLNRAPEHESEGEIFSRATFLFNAERYWECHEVLEGLWRRKFGDEKRLLQGIILVCAAFVHHQKGEEEVALGVLERGVKLLEYPQKGYGGFDLAKIKREAHRMLKTRELAIFSI